MMLDGQRIINGKQRDMRYDGQIKELQYQTVLKDAQDTNHEDKVRRDTNFKAVCDKINERLEAKDTSAALKEYDYAISLMAKSPSSCPNLSLIIFKLSMSAYNTIISLP